MLHKRHGIIDISRPHLTHSRTEACDGQDHDIAHLLRLLDPREIGPRDISQSRLGIKVPIVIEILIDLIGPPRRTGELDDALAGLVTEGAGLFPFQRLFGDGGDDIRQHGMARFRLNRPLAELHASRVPLGPVLPIRISLDANHQAERRAGNGLRYPVVRRFERRRVDVAVDPPASEQDQIPEEVGLEDRQWQGVVGFEHERDRGVEMLHQRHGGGVGDDLVHEARMLLRPAGLLGSQLFVKRPRRRRVLPRLPDVAGEFALDVVGELVLELVPQRARAGVVERLLVRSLGSFGAPCRRWIVRRTTRRLLLGC